MSTFDLTGQQIRNTYTRVLQIDSSSVDFYKPIYDGIGNPIYYAAIKVESCSYADTAASMGGVTNIPGSSSWSSQSFSSSYAITASYSLNGGGSSVFPAWVTESGLSTTSLFSTQSTYSTYSKFSTQSIYATQSLTASYINQTSITQLITSSYSKYSTTAGSSNTATSVPEYTNLTEYDNGTQNDSYTIDFKNGSYQKITIGTSIFTMSFNNNKTYCRNYVIKCINSQENTDILFNNDGTISRIYWIEGISPKSSPSAGSIDLYSFYFDGDYLYGQIGRNFLTTV